MRVFIIGGYPDEKTNMPAFDRFCREIGQNLAMGKLTLLMCSPMDKSADASIMEGVKSVKDRNLAIEIYYPGIQDVDEEWNQQLEDYNSPVTKFRQEATATGDPQALKYAWLFCQLQAIRNADFIIVIGGRIEGSSNFAVRIADAQSKSIIPVSKFGGVGELFFEKKRYQLMDAWGRENVTVLFEELHADKLIHAIVNGSSHLRLARHGKAAKELVFFISYSRERPAEADFVETILRRRNYQVIRDERDIEPGEDVLNALKENIHKSDVFIALWNREYACSPWCFDEINIALESHHSESKSLWIFRTDKTRLVPPKARRILYYDAETREEIEGRILSLLPQH